MANWIKALLLGVVEGLTEFLPVSSTGHLILINQWIGFDDSFTMKFDVIIQLGAILAVVVFFREKLFDFRQSSGSWLRSPGIEIWKKTLVGVIPALVLGALLHSYIERLLFNPFTVAIALVGGGFVLLLMEHIRKDFPIRNLDDLSYRTCFLIGMMQCLAMIPGTSRSAATIIGAMALGCCRIVAVEYSFFLAIPTMVAATAYALLKMRLSVTVGELTVLIVGFVTAFIVAWGVIAAFMSWIRRQNFSLFGYYRIVLGSLILAYFIVI